RLPPEVAESGGASEVSLHVFAAALVDDFAPLGVAHVCRAVARRHQVAAHVVHALPEHDLYHVQTLVQDDDLEGLTTAGDTHLNLFIVHVAVHSVGAAAYTPAGS